MLLASLEAQLILETIAGFLAFAFGFMLLIFSVKIIKSGGKAPRRK